MRMKDCISHEDKPDQPFTDRCITKVQFKQKMKALITSYTHQVLDDLEKEAVDVDTINPTKFIQAVPISAIKAMKEQL